MKKQLIVALILLVLILPAISAAEKLDIVKSDRKLEFTPKIHPLEREFSKPVSPSKSRGDNKLLVLLVEFNDSELIEDNLETTGNGKFLQDPSDYPLTLGKPPHDHEFFSLQLEALKHYYRAASLYYDNVTNDVGFDLEYDIYPIPEEGEPFQAYTLPEAMSYYTPVGVDYQVLISRFEDYFQHCFTIADQDENIDFSQYEHFMLIHAGSDWQHDIMGDTPSDMPSFFIQIGTGKEVIVDDGIIIDHACNVPEMISQDIQTETVGDVEFVDGYGLINAVMAHEFGHSMGFVDLYNTLNYYPAVGYYDIMDSGGLGRLTFPVNSNGEIDYEDYQYIFDLEGCLPVLPGAWSRCLAWGDDFRSRGILKDIGELEFDELIDLNPAEVKTTPDNDLPYFIKVPLSETEYLLIENRQVDPDGDGGTAVQSSEDKRVILFPTPISDNNPDTVSYEYDYLLPGWFKSSGEAIGGGLVIWHIDEELLYENDNFANNTINPSRNRRAVKIIEADGIEDIGNPDVPSWSWRGTEFDPFYKYSALLNDDGDFLNWNIIESPTGSVATHNDSLSGISSPPLTLNNGIPSIYSIYNISSYNLGADQTRQMSFKIGTYLFDNNELLTQKDSIRSIGLIGNSYDFSTFPLVSDQGVDFFTNISGTWLENPFSSSVNLNYSPTLPIVNFDYLADDFNERNEYLIIENNRISFVTPFSSQENPPYQLEFSSYLTEPPFLIDGKLIVSTEEKLFIGSDSLSIPNAKMTYLDNELVICSNDQIYFIDPSDLQINDIVDLKDSFGNFDIIAFSDTLVQNNSCSFIQSNTGKLYKISHDKKEKIFNLYPYTDISATNLALGNFTPQGNPNLIFAAGNWVFALNLDGTLLQGFPKYFEEIDFKPYSYPRIINFNSRIILQVETNYDGYLALDINAEEASQFNIFWQKPNWEDQYYLSPYNNGLDFIYADKASNLYASTYGHLGNNDLIWSGYRNNSYSLFSGLLLNETPVDDNLIAYAYPNPAKKGEVKIKVIDDTDQISLKIFDIAGNLVFNRNFDLEYYSQKDIIWDTRKIASGVYYGVVKSGKQSKKIAIAIEN